MGFSGSWFSICAVSIFKNVSKSELIFCDALDGLDWVCAAAMGSEIMKLYLYINAIRFVAGVWSILALYDWGSHIWAVFGGRMLRARLRGAGIGVPERPNRWHSQWKSMRPLGQSCAGSWSEPRPRNMCRPGGKSPWNGNRFLPDDSHVWHC